MKGLNRGQQCIVNNILYRMLSNERFDIFMSGGSGVGKSRVIQAVYQTLIRKFNKDTEKICNPCVISAYTGKAAFNVGGLTLHSLFHLPTKSRGNITPLSSAILMQCKRNFAFTLLFIIDEISLVGSRVFGWIINRVNQITELKDSGELKVSFLVVGDFAQLQPVLDNWIFCMNGQSGAVKNMLGNPNWEPFQMYELTEIMRQRDDKTFAETLRKIGDLGIEFCSERQIELLNSRIFPSIEQIPEDTIILTHSNEAVKEFNKERIEKCGKEVVVNEACDYADGKDKNCKTAEYSIKSLKNISREDACGLPGTLLLVLGKKYQLTSNLKTSDGMANGNLGNLMKIIMHSKTRKTNCAVKRVYLKFDDPSIGEMTRRANKHAAEDKAEKDWTVIECKDVTLKTSKNKNLKYEIKRSQLPLVESEAMTIHKSQGQTYSSVAVNITKGMTQALLYVALSRATKLEGLYLFGRRSNGESITSILTDEQIAKIRKRNAMESLREERNTTGPKIVMTRMRNNAMINNRFPFMFTGININLYFLLD